MLLHIISLSLVAQQNKQCRNMKYICGDDECKLKANKYINDENQASVLKLITFEFLWCL